MPSINLRLTDEQHANLKDAAWKNRRSLQREVLTRLFEAQPVSGIPETPKLESEQPRTPVVHVPPVEEQGDHFKPDFGRKLGGRR